MKHSFLLFSIFYLLTAMQAQDFLWAHSFQVSECNEVGALTVDTSGNIIIAGVHNGPVYVPYKGDIYIIKTDPDGEILWNNDITGELILGDIAAINNDMIIAGEGYGTFTYNDIQYGGPDYFLFVLKLDASGDLLWYYQDEEKTGAYAANLSVGDDNKFILHTRTQTNLGDWIMLFDTDGNILKTKLLSPTQTLIVDASYYNGNVYLNGEINGFSSVTIDTIFIPQSPLESTAFVLSLDSTLTAQWVAIDTTLNNGDGKIRSNSNGVFVYQETLQPPFTTVHNLKKFNHAGELINEIVVPAYNAFASLQPAMAITADRVALFIVNSTGPNNYKVAIFDKDLGLIEEKTITGQTDQYSNQMNSQGENFIVSHVYLSTLNLNNELTLPYEGMGKLPYIAKIGEPLISGINSVNPKPGYLRIYPNPAKDRIHIKVQNSSPASFSVKIMNLRGKQVLQYSNLSSDAQVDVSNLQAGVYLLQISFAGDKIQQEKLIIQ